MKLVCLNGIVGSIWGEVSLTYFNICLCRLKFRGVSLGWGDIGVSGWGGGGSYGYGWEY